MPLQSVIARAVCRFVLLSVSVMAIPFSSLHSQPHPLHVREEMAVTRSSDARVPVEAGSFAVASDGSDFLVAWNSAPTTRIARVTGEGVLLDRGGLVIDARTNAAPTLIWGGENYFLFGFENGELLLRRITRRGDLLDPVPLVIARTGDDVPPAIAVASNGNGALVILNRTNLEGVRVGRGGEVGPRFTIARRSGSFVSAATRVAVASTGLSYLVAWFALAGSEHELRSATVTGEGAFLESTVATLYTTRKKPSELTAGSIGGGLVLAWGERTSVSGPEIEIKARVPSAFGSTVFNVATGPFSNLRVTSAEGPGAFLLWSGSDATTRGQLLRTPLTSAAAPVIEATSRFASGFRAEVAISLASHLIVRSDLLGVLSASIVTDAGMSRPLPAGFVTAAASQSNPAATSGDDVAAAVWNEGGGRIVFGRIDARGTALDPGALVVAPPDNDANPTLSFDGDSYLVCWERYNRERAKSEIHGRMLSRRGAFLGEPFLVADLASRPVAIWSGLHHFVFVERRSGEAGFVRVSKAGVVIDPAIRPVAKQVDGYQRSFSVARSPSGLLIAWQEGFDARHGCPTLCTPAVSRIHAARLSPDGAVLDPEGILVSRRVVSVDPVALWNGSSFVVLWAHLERGSLGPVPRAPVFAAVISSEGRPEPQAGEENGREIVATLYTDSKRSFSAAPDERGGLLVAWMERKTTTSFETDLFISRAVPDGQLIGSPSRLATSTDPESIPLVTPLSSGGAVVFYTRWASEDEYGGAARIFGRLVTSTPARSRSVSRR